MKKHDFQMKAADVTNLINHRIKLNIVNGQSVKNNLNEVFYFFHWKNAIDLNFFIITCRCVSSALFNVNVANQRSAVFKVNACSYKINSKKFKNEMLKIHQKELVMILKMVLMKKKLLH